MKYIWTLLMLSSLILGYGQSSSEESLEKSITNSYTIDAINSQFLIKGTSSLHDWEMVSQSFTGTIETEFLAENLTINDIKISVGIETLKSGKRIMDNKCYSALKYEEHPNIKYQFKKISSLSSAGSGKYKAVLNGTLSLAGASKNISIDVAITKTTNGIIITGEKPLKMTDFGVEPPTALLGTLKTGDAITIVFNLTYK